MKVELLNFQLYSAISMPAPRNRVNPALSHDGGLFWALFGGFRRFSKNRVNDTPAEICV